MSEPVFMIAEAGVNHNGCLDLALKMVDTASEAGADAIKFQIFDADQLVVLGAEKANYQRCSGDRREDQHQMLRGLELSKHDFFKIKEHCLKRQIKFLASPFDSDSLSFLVDELEAPVVKFGSGEISSLPLLMEAARKGVSMILSTGMSDIEDVCLALGTIAYGYMNTAVDHSALEPSKDVFLRTFGSEEAKAIIKERITLLHCTSEYPAPFESINLRAMKTLRDTFDLPVGFSDHSRGVHVSLAAVALGATTLEKHFTLDKNMVGPDHKASLDPEELKRWVRETREVAVSLGSEAKNPQAVELENRKVVRKSLVALKPIPKGDSFSEQNLGIKRPGGGLPPYRYWEFLGKVANKDFRVDDPIVDC